MRFVISLKPGAIIIESIDHKLSFDILILAEFLAGINLGDLTDVFLHPLPPMVLNGVLHVLLILGYFLIASIDAVVVLYRINIPIIHWQLINTLRVIVVLVHVLSLQVAWVLVLVELWVLVNVVDTLILNHL